MNTVTIITLTIAVLILISFTALRKMKQHRRSRLVRDNAYALARIRSTPRYKDRPLGKDGDYEKPERRFIGAHESKCRYRKTPVINQGPCSCDPLVEQPKNHKRGTLDWAIHQDLELTTAEYTHDELKTFNHYYSEALGLQAARERTLEQIQRIDEIAARERKRTAEAFRELDAL